MATMQAVRFHSYGGPEVLVLEEVPRPQAGAGEVLIRVHAAGVNPIDWKVRAGHVKDWLPHRLPLIPGWDVSGVVEAVAPGVTTFKVGDAVYGMLDFMRNGAYAEYVAARTGELVRKPRSIDHVQAAAVPLAALTAWQSLFEVASLAPWHTVLIHAAAGGVGHFAVQFAKWKGAKVIGTASANNESFLRELGADEVIDYRTTQFEEVVREVDVVLLHRAVLEGALGIMPQAVVAEANLSYEREAAAAIAAVDQGAAQLAFLLNPVAVEQVMRIATAGEVLPQKSTDFYPKLLSGVTIYRL